MWTQDMFGVEKPIIALLHLDALPGDPGYCGDMKTVTEHARKDLLALQDGGVDGILFANEFSLPYQPVADIAVVSAMAYIIGKLKDEISVPFGVNVVKNPIATIDLGAATGAKFGRSCFSGAYMGEYGVIETTGQECANLGFGKVLVITDPFLASSEHYKKLKKSLDDAKIENFLLTNVKPNPRAEDCDEMAEFAKKNHVDALIALGGGSAMDQAKAVGAVVTNGKSTVEWGDTELDTNILPLICIPSTSGTGAEVTWCAVITDTERQYKMTVGDPVHMIPVLAICDPEITIGLPKSLTAACGVDALTHCIEAYTVQLHQPITDALALKGISMIAENLEKAYENGEDREARRNMMIASTIGGMAFISSNVGAVHAFAETVGAWFDTPHGVANSLFLPYIMEFNIPACPERFADIADAMGIEREESMSDEQYALKAVEYVKALNRKLNIPTIKEIKGITEERFEAIAERSANNVLSNDNARKITKEDYLELLKKAYNE